MSPTQIPIKPLSPILRWAGSKKRSLPHLLHLIPQSYGRYIEVFAGSACLFFALRPKRAIIADNNVDLVHFYKTVSRHPIEVYEKVISIPRRPSMYYNIRAADIISLDDTTRSAYFLFLNRNCFNGIFRTNVRGQFNVPFSSKRVQPYPLADEFCMSATALARSTLKCADFESVCRRDVREGDFVYLDPPYYVPKRRVFREYSSKPFSESDVVRLAKLLCEIDRRGAYFLLSYPDCGLIKSLAARWELTQIRVRRTIAGNMSSRGYAPEVLIRNFDIDRRSRPYHDITFA
jgi:DNA adenine methylase